MDVAFGIENTGKRPTWNIMEPRPRRLEDDSSNIQTGVVVRFHVDLLQGIAKLGAWVGCF